MTRVYNFGAGPAMLPESVLKQAQEEFLDWQGLGMSVLEVGHRTEAFQNLLDHAQKTLRMLLSIPKDYSILFLGGAARTQFAMIPLNFSISGKPPGYIISGIWSQLAFKEAQHLTNAYCVATSEADGFKSVPNQQEWTIHNHSSYIYFTPNETINGVRYPYQPKVGEIPLIADMTSCLLSEPIDIRNYDLIFAGAQKNIANAGLTLVIIKKDILQRIPQTNIPTMLDYKVHIKHQSAYATPPVFNIYLAAKMFEWLQERGGIESVFRENCLKAAKLYQFLDSSEFYTPSVEPEARSIMNICFSLKEQSLEKKFLEQAESQGLCGLKGHRLVGGLRASLYNAMPLAAVDLLIDFMRDFEKGH